jgi:heptosyltransferase I
MPRINANKICLLRTSALGDVIHALAFVNGLRKGYPDAHLTWILQTLPYEIVKYQKNIDRFIIYERKGGLQSWRNLFGQLREEYYDLVLIPQVSAKVSLISLFVRANNKLGFDVKRSREFHWLATNKRIPSRPNQHVQDQFFEFLDFLEVKDYPIEWNVTFTDDERQWRKSFFRGFKRPVISFVIASSNIQKDWHPQGYAQVIDYVNNIVKMQPMLIGGPSTFEKKIADKICGLCKSNPAVALGEPIRNMILQISGSSMVVSPDTGPLHIAVALDVPTVGLYGYSDPRRCGPYKKYHDLLIDKYTNPGEEDTPITRKTRPNRMGLITPGEVIEKIELGIEKYVRI